MSNDSLARELSAGGEPSDPIYDALVAALRSNARGRAFLDEYARRARAADTAAALAALARIEALLLKGGTEEPAAEAQAVDPDDAYVPFEFEPPPDTSAAVVEAAPDSLPTSLPAPTRSADLMAQVMALSAEERIALFS